MQHVIEKKPGCIAYAIQVIGDKWSPLIIRDLSSNSHTFGDLQLSLEGISPRTLSQRLDKLELSGIVSKQLYCEHPPRYRYVLTQKGQDLQAIVIKMAEWGERHA